MDKKGKEIVKTLESKAKLLSNEKIVRFLQKSIRAEDETRIIVLDKEIQERMKPLEPRSKRKNNHNVCVECGQNVDIREASLFSGMVITLIRIEKWCKENDRHEFIRKEIEHLLDKNTKARFGDWVYFGGLIYSRGKGKWGMNLDRTEQFLKGELEIYTRANINPLNKEVKLSDKRKIGSVSNLKEFLDEDSYYKSVYKAQDIVL